MKICNDCERRTSCELPDRSGQEFDHCECIVKKESICDECKNNDLERCIYKNELLTNIDACRHKEEKPDILDDSFKLPIREDLYDFMVAMERVLKENDHKGGWKTESVQFLYEKFKIEVDEVNQLAKLTFLDICNNPNFLNDSFNIKAQFEKELIDVANMCMMIWSKL